MTLCNCIFFIVLPALEGFLLILCVHVDDMFSQNGRIPEALPALLASKRPLMGIGHVSVEEALAFEHLDTYGAGKLL